MKNRFPDFLKSTKKIFRKYFINTVFTYHVYDQFDTDFYGGVIEFVTQKDAIFAQFFPTPFYFCPPAAKEIRL